MSKGRLGLALNMSPVVCSFCGKANFGGRAAKQRLLTTLDEVVVAVHEGTSLIMGRHLQDLQGWIETGTLTKYPMPLI
jgi:hypothetical protein